MIDDNYRKIKERMRNRSMELWEVSDPRALDPLIDLMLDVFSYELSKVYQDVKISDSKLLERISKILVNEKWSLPLPSHALLKAMPSERMDIVGRTTHFYLQKAVKTERLYDVFFTPLNNHTIIDAHVYCTCLDEKIVLNDEYGETKIELQAVNEQKVGEYNLWLGISIKPSLLKKLETLPICILLNGSLLDSYIKMIDIFDESGNKLALTPRENTAEKEEHYFESVHTYYKNYLYDIDISNSSKKQQTLINRVGDTFDAEELVAHDTDLFWLRLSFPVAFTKEELGKIAISLNTFPIVNRKLSDKQHSLKKNGKIVSISPLSTECFLNIEYLIDDKGEEFQSVLKNNIDDLEGSYSLFFGDVEQFDERNAKSVLNKVIQTVREEGSSFSAVGYDLLNAYLEDLNKKLDELQQKVDYGYKGIKGGGEKVYLLSIPYETSDVFECSYWVSDLNMVNGIEKGTLLSEYKSGGLVANSIILQTESIGGVIRKGEKEKIRSLRYGLISKDRIVSNEDIKSFIKMTVGKIIQTVDIKPGVGLSTNRKQGLVRTVDVFIKISSEGKLDEDNKKRLSHFLQMMLQNKSVQTIPYNVNIT
ncbi:MAG: hypothetical protein JKY08_10295 [Flavobacteriaceae bacterium]|nr:hypothetical protein [Flavobacteriaceae bacterium]